MDNLTIALVVLAVLVLCGLIAHGAWSARKAGPRRAAMPTAHAEHREPVLGDAPGFADDEGPPTLPERRYARRGSARLDALIDAFATLALDAPLGGEQLAAQLPAARRAGSKPLLIEGLNVASGEWEAPLADERYSELQAGVQLANRSGALNEIEYSEFVQTVQTFADAIPALPDFPDMLDVMSRARELDAFASQHDAQLALHLQARATVWSVGYVREHARRHGFMPGLVPGRLILPAAEEGDPPVLTLSFDSQAALADEPDRAAVRDLTLSFDVPQTDPAAEPFAAWQHAAEALAADMDAAVVDDNGRPLDAAGFAAIHAELATLYAALQARDLAAGSAAARRLFS